MTQQQQHLPSTARGETSALLLHTISTSANTTSKETPTQQQHGGSASVAETIINESKTCMGTGCLALPYAARVGGVLLHVSGLFAICLWNIYSVHRLCQCLQLIPKEDQDRGIISIMNNNNNNNNVDEAAALELELEQGGENNNHHHDHAAAKRHNNSNNKPRAESITSQEEASQTVLELSYSHSPPPPCHHRPRYDGTNNPQSQSTTTITSKAHDHHQQPHSLSDTTTFHAHPPRGTSTYSRVAWYAFGPIGLWTLDGMMVTLFIGVVVAFVDATRGFLRDTPVTSGSDLVDAVGIAFIIGPLSTVPDIGYLSRASATGLAVLFVSFAAIALYGWTEYDSEEDMIISTIDAAGNSATTIDTAISNWNWMPENGMEGVSQWFGCVVFGYGIAPLTYNFRESMVEPNQMVRASTAALLIVAGSYVILGVGLYALFPNIDGDVLHTLPSTGWLPVVIRLSMAVVVFVTAPLLILPCGQLIEGKIAKDSAASEVPYSIRAMVRLGIALTCVSISVLVPGFVSVLSLVGCASVAAVGFVVPPLLYLRLRYLRNLWSWDLILDVAMLLWGMVATGITTSYTFQNVLAGK